MADNLDINKYLPNENPVQNKFSPTHDLRRDYSFNAPSFYDYLANFNQGLRIISEYSNKNREMINDNFDTLNNYIISNNKKVSNLEAKIEINKEDFENFKQEIYRKFNTLNGKIDKNKEEFERFTEKYSEFAQSTKNFSDIVTEYIEKDLGSGDGNLGDYTELADRITRVEKIAEKNFETLKEFDKRNELQDELYQKYNELLQMYNTNFKEINNKLDTLTDSVISQANAIKVLQDYILKG